MATHLGAEKAIAIISMVGDDKVLCDIIACASVEGRRWVKTTMVLSNQCNIVLRRDFDLHVRWWIGRIVTGVLYSWAALMETQFLEPDSRADSAKAPFRFSVTSATTTTTPIQSYERDACKHAISFTSSSESHIGAVEIFITSPVPHAGDQ